MTDPDKSGRDHAGRWQKGISGNPAGKPHGARVRAVVELERLMGNCAENVAMAVIRCAESGDTAAARLVLERVMPARKDNPVTLDLPAMDTAQGALAAGTAIMDATASGQITPDEADKLMGLVERQRKIIETADLAERLTALEKRTDK